MVRALRIKDFPDYYITDTGDVYSRKEYHNPQGRIKRLTQNNKKQGYISVCLYKNQKRHYKLIHRLVAEAFIPNPENKPEVNHKNGIKTDNRVENLEWVSSSENKLHSCRILGTKKRPKVIQQIKNGKIIATFGWLIEAQRKTGIHFSHISDCCLGKRKNAGGYQWKRI